LPRSLRSNHRRAIGVTRIIAGLVSVVAEKALWLNRQSSNRRHVFTRPARIDVRRETPVIPVPDIHRAKQFYANVGSKLDAEPLNAAYALQFGIDMRSAAAGSVQGLYLIVSDIEATRGEPVAPVNSSEVFHSAGVQFQPDGANGNLIAFNRPEWRNVALAGGHNAAAWTTDGGQAAAMKRL
jgi:hypothetical protein